MVRAQYHNHIRIENGHVVRYVCAVCLITCDYAGKMVRKECLLVFIRDKKGAPVATAEIKKNGSVNQFYGDESSRDIKVMRPGPKVQECLNSWLEKYKDDVINALKGAA